MEIQQINGLNYVIPLESNLTAVFTLPDGLLIETEYKVQPTFKTVKEMVLNINMEIEEEKSLCYFSLNFHPYQDFKPVKIDGEYCFFKRNVSL